MDREVTHPYLYIYPLTNGEPQSNLKNTKIELPIHDLRGYTPEQLKQLGFVTDHAGFQVVEGWGKQDTQELWKKQNWEDEQWIEKEYYADVDELVKKETGAISTFIFDHTVRKRRTADTENLPDTADNRKPVALVHIDQSRKAGEARITKHLGQETLEKVLRGELRAQLINVWRPLRGPVVDTPLAYADFRSVDTEKDLRPSELRYPTWTGETLAVYPNSNHKWYYLSNMTIDETIFLKCYDSETEVKTPHTAFKDPTTPPDAEPRWSIEVRVLALLKPTATTPTTNASTSA